MFFYSINDFFGRDDFQSVSEGAAPAEENRAELNGGSELNAVVSATDNDGFFSELIIDDIQQVGICLEAHLNALAAEHGKRLFAMLGNIQ